MTAAIGTGAHPRRSTAGHDIELNLTVALRLTYRMTNSQRLAKVRARLADWLLSQSDAEVTIESESILIRDDFYCGRRFNTATHHAVWFIEEDEVKIYTQDGQLVAVLHSNDIDRNDIDRNDIDELGHDTDPPRVIKLPAAAETNETRRAA